MYVHGSSTLASYTLGYQDLTDRLASQQSSADGTTTDSYKPTDPLNELTGATHTGFANEAYAYDADGNRTGTSMIIGAYNRLTQDAQYTYLYDNEGNRTRRTDRTTGYWTEYYWRIREFANSRIRGRFM